MGRNISIQSVYNYGLQNNNNNNNNNKTVQIILKYQYDNIETSMEGLKILNIYQRICFYRIAKFLFKISESVTAAYMSQMFSFPPANESLQPLRTTSILKFKHQDQKKNFFSSIA